MKDNNHSFFDFDQDGYIDPSISSGDSPASSSDRFTVGGESNEHPAPKKEKFEINIADDDFFEDSRLEDYPEEMPGDLSSPVDPSLSERYRSGDTGYIEGMDDFAFDYDSIYQNRMKTPQQESVLYDSRLEVGPELDENSHLFTASELDEDEGHTRLIDPMQMQQKQREMLQDERRKKAKKKARKTTNTLLYITFVVVASILLSVFALNALNDILGMYKEDAEIVVTIPEDASTWEIAGVLKDSGVIQQRLTFVLYANFRHADGKMKGGENITLNAGYGYDEIITILKGISSTKDVVSLTFYEGMTVNEIAAQLEENQVCSAADFKKAMQETDFGYTFETLIPDDPNRFYRLEGYIFPDSYDFYIGERPESVVKKFVANFNKKFTKNYYERLDELGMSLDELITLASMIQKESYDEESMYFVSSVFYNRLKEGSPYPKLQSDVTRDYANNQIKPFEDSPSQERYDAYNTYVCDGLPVGPICNPGKSAIEAALYPESTSYYFFVTDEENNFYYARTYQQHLANVQKAEAVGEGKIHGTDTGDEE